MYLIEYLKKKFCTVLNVNQRILIKTAHIKKDKIMCAKIVKRKFNNLTDTIFHYTHLSYEQVEKAFDSIINHFTIRKMAKLIKVSTKTAFTLRHKIMSCLKSIVDSFKLKGKIKLDEYYLSINLKGTKQQDMPKSLM